MGKIRQLVRGFAIVAAPALRLAAALSICGAVILSYVAASYALGAGGLQAVWIAIAAFVLLVLLISAADFVGKCFVAGIDDDEGARRDMDAVPLPSNVVKMPARMHYKRLQ